MSNIDDMLGSLFNNDEDNFTSSFENEIKERLSGAIIDKNLNISKDILSDEVDEVDEVDESAYRRGGVLDTSKKLGRFGRMTADEMRGGAKKNKGYTFKSPKDAKEFIVSLAHMGIKKNNIIQKGKTISVNIRDKNTLQMVQAMARELKATIKEDNIINVIKEVYSSESGVEYVLKDSSNIHIMPIDAKNIIEIHDSLNEDNQILFREMISKNKDDFEKILSFCTEKANIKETNT